MTRKSTQQTITAEEVRAHGGDIKAALAARDTQQRNQDATERAQAELDGADENAVVAEIIAALKEHGFSTDDDGGPRGFVKRAGQHRADKSGSDPGVPDLLVFVRGLPFALGFEVKARTKGARVSKAQRALCKACCINVVNHADQVLEIVFAAQRLFPDGGQLAGALWRKS